MKKLIYILISINILFGLRGQTSLISYTNQNMALFESGVYYHSFSGMSPNYVKIGYSNTDVKIHLNRIYSMPLFYILITVLGFVVINKIKNFKSRFFVIIF